MLKRVRSFFKKRTKDKTLNLFDEQYKAFDELNLTQRFPPLSKEDIYPCINDNTAITSFDAHYIYHPAWAARIIKKTAPEKHVDISSTLHFCSMLSAFVKTEFYDFRPASLTLDNLICLKADLADLHFESGSIISLSCMHTIEHIGLGRYGDPIDAEGDMKAIDELKRVCAKNGDLFIVVPVGIKRIQFNAHRIYHPMDMINYMDGFILKNFSLITDDGLFIDNADLNMAAIQKYGCGCYWFTKLS
jgi:hypothetical protein